MKKVFLGIALAIVNLVSMAQINVFSGNNVGIGGFSNSLSALSVYSPGYSYSTMSLEPSSSTIGRGLLVLNIPSSSATYIGIGSALTSTTGGYGALLRGIWGSSYNQTAQTTGQNYGVVGTAGNAALNCGVWGNLNGSNGGAGVYGSVGQSGAVTGLPSDLTQYAGYFSGGDVKIATGKLWIGTAPITSSDKRIKKNIAVLDSSDKILTLQPKKYNLKTRSELISSGIITVSKSDTAKTVTSNRSDTLDYMKRQHYGFLAQDIQKVFPNLVYTTSDGTLGVDYQGLIPIIIAQLQVMKTQIDDKDTRIDALEKTVAKLKAKN
jgi:hypothetical protein